MIYDIYESTSINNWAHVHINRSHMKCKQSSILNMFNVKNYTNVTSL
jgi:hypothetical protein